MAPRENRNQETQPARARPPLAPRTVASPSATTPHDPPRSVPDPDPEPGHGKSPRWKTITDPPPV